MKTICLYILIALSAGPVWAESPPLRMVYFEDFAPFSWQENGRMKGIYIDITDAILGNAMGLKVVHDGFPWKRAQLMVRKNTADAFITVPTTERKTYTRVSGETVDQFKMALFTHRENPAIQRLRQITALSGLKDFHTVNYLGNGWAKQHLKDMAIDWVPTQEEALMLLSRNRYDLYVGSLETVRYRVRQLPGKDNIIELPMNIDAARHHLCIGKESSFSHILPEFDRAFSAFKASGKLREIYQKYH